MKKWIIPVCLACMMLVPTCKRDTGGDHGVAGPDRGFDYGKNSYTQTQSSEYRERSSKDSSGVKKATQRSVIPGRTRRENKTGTTVVTGSKKNGNIQRDASIVSNRIESKRKVENREQKPGGLLEKPRVDVPDVK